MTNASHWPSSGTLTPLSFELITWISSIRYSSTTENSFFNWITYPSATSFNNRNLSLVRLLGVTADSKSRYWNFDSVDLRKDGKRKFDCQKAIRQLLCVCFWESHMFDGDCISVCYVEKCSEQIKPNFSYSVANENIWYFWASGYGRLWIFD